MRPTHNSRVFHGHMAEAMQTITEWLPMLAKHMRNMDFSNLPDGKDTELCRRRFDCKCLFIAEEAIARLFTPLYSIEGIDDALHVLKESREKELKEVRKIVKELVDNTQN